MGWLKRENHQTRVIARANSDCDVLFSVDHVGHWRPACAVLRLEAPQILAVFTVERVEGGITAADKHQTSLGDNCPHRTYRSELIWKLDALEHRVSTYLGVISEGN